jgi:hypothetical protein
MGRFVGTALLWELDYLVVLISKGSEANWCMAF